VTIAGAAHIIPGRVGATAPSPVPAIVVLAIRARYTGLKSLGSAGFVRACTTDALWVLVARFAVSLNCAAILFWPFRTYRMIVAGAAHKVSGRVRATAARPVPAIVVVAIRTGRTVVKSAGNTRVVRADAADTLFGWCRRGLRLPESRCNKSSTASKCARSHCWGSTPTFPMGRNRGRTPRSGNRRSRRRDKAAQFRVSGQCRCSLNRRRSCMHRSRCNFHRGFVVSVQ
jgi:hypothetical protein